MRRWRAVWTVTVRLIYPGRASAAPTRHSTERGPKAIRGTTRRPIALIFVLQLIILILAVIAQLTPIRAAPRRSRIGRLLVNRTVGPESMECKRKRDIVGNVNQHVTLAALHNDVSNIASSGD